VEACPRSSGKRVRGDTSGCVCYSAFDKPSCLRTQSGLVHPLFVPNQLLGDVQWRYITTQPPSGLISTAQIGRESVGARQKANF
jgi:hypothetical protein